MPGFFFRPVDLSSLALLFVAALAGWRLITLPRRRPAGGWLMFFFASSALFALFSIVANARLDVWQFYAIHLQVAFSALGVASLLQYIYRAGDIDPQGREARIAWGVSLAGLLYVFGWAMYQFGQLSLSGDPSTSTALSEGLTSLGLVWALVVSIRQERHSSAGLREQEGTPTLKLLILGVVLLLTASGFQFIGGVLRWFSPKSIYTVYIAAMAVIVIGFNYFLNWDRGNSRVNRVIAAALVLLQSIFAVLAVVFSAQLAANPLPPTLLEDLSLVLQPDGTGGYLLAQTSQNPTPLDGQPIENGETLIQLDAPVVFFGREYSTLLVRPGRLLFGEQWSAQKANYYLQPHIFVANLPGSIEGALSAEVAESAEQVTVRWSLPDGGAAQVSIDHAGTLELSYTGLGEKPLRSWGLSAGRGLDGVAFLSEFPPSEGAIPPSGALFEYSFAERLRTDAWTRPLLYFQLAVSVLVVAILYAVRGRLESQNLRQLGQSLNGHQLEIARLVAAGESNAEIAKALSITEATVKYHLTRIFQTLNLKSRRALASWYREMANKQD